MTIDNFINTIKDCWTGREFKFENMVGTAIIKIISDNGEDLKFTFQWFNNNGSESKKAYSTDTMNKEELKKSITNAGYWRLK